MEYVQNVLGYHCNDLDRCREYVENTLHMITAVEDGAWLGTGMYFWDTISNAEYWKREKKKKDPHREYRIVKSHLDLTNVLDLTDSMTYRQLERLWKALSNRIGLDECPDSVPLGKKLNLLFEHTALSRFPLVKVGAIYPKTPPCNFFGYDPMKNAPQPFPSFKIIYCVKNDGCILSRSLHE